VVRESIAIEFAGPGFVLPEQIFDGPRKDANFSPERALMLAVLEDGIRCFREFSNSRSVHARKRSREAEQWIRSRDWDWPFSFNNVCDCLGLDPAYLRGRLLRFKYEYLVAQANARAAAKARAEGRLVDLESHRSSGKRAAGREGPSVAIKRAAHA